MKTSKTYAVSLLYFSITLSLTNFHFLFFRPQFPGELRVETPLI